MNKVGHFMLLNTIACLTAVAETTTFEDPPVSGTPTSLPAWSGFSPVVLQYGVGDVQDSLAGAGSQALEMDPESAVAWSPGDLTAPAGQLLVSTFLLRLDTLSSDAPVTPSEVLSAVVFANTSGLMALDGNGSGGGTWQTLQALAVDTFYSVTVTRDYGSQTYDVVVNGSLVADDFGFKDAVSDGPFPATFETSERAWLDDVAAVFSDLTPPMPDPMSFASAPMAASATSVSMTATAASDPSGPVEYYFECTTPGGHDSDWQADPTYTDSGLISNVSYTYQVKARDAGGNETGYSDPAAVTPVADNDPPQVTLLSPGHQSTGVAVDSGLVLTLDEMVQKGSGNLRIKENLGNELVATIDIASVTVDNAEVSISLPAVLAHGTTYYVEVDAGALLDLSGNAFGGIAGSKTWSFSTAVATGVSPSLIAHYPFDVNISGSTPDSAGANSASLGASVSVHASGAKVGSGSLFMDGSDSSAGSPADGAVTSNSFAWASDARTLTFWWKSAGETHQGTFVSYGADSAGQRFDVKDANNLTNDLRVEIGGAGQDSQPANFDDGNWHFVAVTVPNNATFADIAWFADGGSTDLNASSSMSAVATGPGPLHFGDSIVGAGGADRVPHGYIDDFQLYDEVLSSGQISFLFNNPGSVIGTPVDGFTAYISDPSFSLAPGEQGFGQDPDGDGLANGLEAWFGTHPGQFNAGITGLTKNGQVTTFNHPQNAVRPADVVGFYQWSPNLVDWYAGDGVDGPPGGPTLTFSVSTEGTTTVTATASGTVDRLFLRAGASQL